MEVELRLACIGEVFVLPKVHSSFLLVRERGWLTSTSAPAPLPPPFPSVHKHYLACAVVVSIKGYEDNRSGYIHFFRYELKRCEKKTGHDNKPPWHRHFWYWDSISVYSSSSNVRTSRLRSRHKYIVPFLASHSCSRGSA